MKLILCDKSKAVVDALRSAFTEFPEVDVIQGDILEVNADAIVATSTSFGSLVYCAPFGLGVVADYRDFFGVETERKVIALIANRCPNFELNVGQALIAKIDVGAFTRMIVTPTMREQGCVANTSNAYEAFRAALTAARQDAVRRLVSPGIATGVGGIHPVRAAEMMRRAWAEVNGYDAPGPLLRINAGMQYSGAVDPGHSHAVPLNGSHTHSIR
ncbi:macro domain-containing protein [Burkholderia diffusa]|uniref:macro domain-containing protein n=1 Tax=Burkholderia diffusa TaxID=488732 RepID=UPI00158BCB13|nr:macro domain-containing protein [Burkholderia diffusa]